MHGRLLGIICVQAIAVSGCGGGDGNDSDAGTVGVRFVDLNRKLWTREGKTALADELASIVREGLDLTPAAPAGAMA